MPRITMTLAIEPMSEEDWPEIVAIHAQDIATGNATFTTPPAASYAEFCDGKLDGGASVARDVGMHAMLGGTALT